MKTKRKGPNTPLAKKRSNILNQRTKHDKKDNKRRNKRSYKEQNGIKTKRKGSSTHLGVLRALNGINEVSPHRLHLVQADSRHDILAHHNRRDETTSVLHHWHAGVREIDGMEKWEKVEIVV